MPEDKEEPTGFRVVDRRSFGANGTRRDASPEEAPPERPSPPAPQAPTPTEAEEEDFEVGPAGFETLVSYLSTTAMFQLGLLQGPGGERIPPDLVNARRTIDLLEVVQQKTRGNLTADEAKLLEDVLYDLRLTYVEMTKRLSQKPK
jgi:hypothetical protein